MRRVALISEHASPLGLLGGVDSGGQNVYVGQVARRLADLGWSVDVLTRRDDEESPDVVPWVGGGRVIHVPAGPARRVRKEDLLPYMAEFTEFVLRRCRRRPYDLIHANFFMSALVAAEVKRASGIPFVVTFHALGRVRRLHQGGADAFPEERLAIEDRAVREADRIIAECPQDAEDLRRLYRADPARVRTIPCGFDPGEFRPIPKGLARASLGLDGQGPILLQLGRMVPRKGVDNVIRALSRLRRGHEVPARLLIVGGESEVPDPALTPEIGRLTAIAVEEKVSDAVTFVGSRGRDALNAYYSRRGRLHYHPLV
jgi:glycosyltransferase involved in cell wall biosynthesis